MTNPNSENDYLTYRGKCKEASEAAVAADPTLRLVCGHYHDPLWGKQEHWWAVRPDGTIHDPTARQFPSKGMGDYVEWDETFECEQCGGTVDMEKASIDGHHVFCGIACHRACVGV